MSGYSAGAEFSDYLEERPVLIKGNQAWRKPRLSGSLVTYQCGEVVVSGKGEVPEP